MNQDVAQALRLISAYRTGRDEACREFLRVAGVNSEELLLALTALANELATFAAAGYRESPEEILQVIARSMTKPEST